MIETKYLFFFVVDELITFFLIFKSKFKTESCHFYFSVFFLLKCQKDHLTSCVCFRQIITRTRYLFISKGMRLNVKFLIWVDSRYKVDVILIPFKGEILIKIIFSWQIWQKKIFYGQKGSVKNIFEKIKNVKKILWR